MQSILHIWNQIPVAAKNIVSGIIIFIIFWFAAKLISRVIQRIGGQKREAVFKTLAHVVKTGIVLIGLISALGTMGVNVAALVASLGLIGFAAGYALKDLLGNIIAGFMILINGTISVGDIISIGGDKGKISRINIRYTVIEDDEKEVMIPNGTVFTQVLTLYKTGTN